MFKYEKKVLLVILILLILGAGFLYDNKNELFGKDFKQEYITSCRESAKKSFTMSEESLYQSCSCSYDKILSLLGEDKMHDFTRVIREKNKEKTDAFLEREEVNIGQLDTAFLSCF